MARIKLPLKKRSKYNNKIVEYCGWTFHSQLELDFYKHLLRIKDGGGIELLLRQIPLLLAPKCKLIVDFMVKYPSSSLIHFYDTKGYMTQTAKTKIAMAEHIYGINIHIIKRGDLE